MVLQSLVQRRALRSTWRATLASRNASVRSALATGSQSLAFSSGMAKDDPNRPQKELTPYQKLQKWMQPFVSGGKALYHENKQAWAIRSRLKAAPSKDVQLTRQEMMILRQAHRDLLKSLPLMLFFCVPLIGYAAPLIGYQFPKQLLPWQFWRPDQKTQFFREDAHARARFYPELVRLLEQIDNKDKCLKEMLAAHRSSDSAAGEGLDPVQVSELVPFFDTTENGPAALPSLPRHHVHVLARSIALVPAFSYVMQLAPRDMVEKYLERRMDELRVDDEMLLKEGVDSLSLSELEFACEERGIVDGYGEIETLRKGLKDWLAMYNQTDGAVEQPVAAQRFPSSLLLHAPALMNPTGRQQ